MWSTPLYIHNPVFLMSMASSTTLPDCVSYVEAHRHFMTLESPTAAVSDTNTKAYQDQLTRALQYMKKCIHQRQLDGVLSLNERLFELQNTQLYAFCIEYYLGILTPKQSFFQQPEAARTQEQQQHSDEQTKLRCEPVDHTRHVVYRIKLLREADMFLTDFLDRSESVGVLPEKTRREQYERLESKQFSLSRDDKIQRFRQQREMEKKLMEVQKRREEHSHDRVGGRQKDNVDELDEDEDDVVDLEREQLMTFIQLSVLKSMEEQAAINQEKDMLETMLKLNAATDKQDLFSETHRPLPTPQGQGIVRLGFCEDVKDHLTRADWFGGL